MKSKLFLIAVIYFAIVIVIAHGFAPPGYDWTHNTISDLGSQGHAYKWIMQAGFIGFGFVLTLGVIVNLVRRDTRRYFLLFVAVYGLSVLMTGIFCTAPINASMAYSVRDANWHSLFATIAGLGMTLGIIWQIIVSANKRERGMRLIFFLLVIGFSGLFGMADNSLVNLDQGIIQRLLYLSGLAWLVYEEQVLSARIRLVTNARM